MRFPRKDVTAGVLFDLGAFAICTITDELEPESFRAHAAPLKTHDTILRAKVAERNTAKDHVTQARARRRNGERRMGVWLRQLGREANAAFEGKVKSLGYLRILPQAPSKLLALPQDERLAAVGDVLTALADPQTPAVLHKHLQAGQLLFDAWKARHQAVAAALGVMKNARHDVLVAREGWFAGYREVHASLRKHFADDPAMVDTYFDDPPKGPAAIADPAEVAAEPEPA